MSFKKIFLCFAKVVPLRFAFVPVATFMLLATTTATLAQEHDKVIGEFIEACKKNANFTETQRRSVLDLIERERKDIEGRQNAITNALRTIYPKFQEALIALGDEQVATAAGQFEKLASSSDPFLAADSSFFLARAKMMDDRYEKALELLTDITNKNSPAKTLHAGEALFMQGVCQARVLKRAEAIQSFQKFLDENFDASERMRVGAAHQIAELKLIVKGSLLDVQSRMEYSGVRLVREDTGDRTRDEQKNIITLLDALIKEAEEQEKSGSGGGGSSGGSQSRSRGKGTQDGSGSGSGRGQGNSAGDPPPQYDKPRSRRYKTVDKSSWSKLRKQEYDKALSALKAKYPGRRYKKLVDQYFKTLREEER